MASSIKGLDKLLSGLDKVSRDFQEEVKDIIGINTQDMYLQARRDCPGAGDMILTQDGLVNEEPIRKRYGWSPIDQSMTYEIDSSGFTGRVIVNKEAGDISAWIEFSTGQSAAKYLLTVPDEWRELAATFYRNGQGRIIGKPYLLPAYEKYSLLTIKDLKQAMKNIKL